MKILFICHRIPYPPNKGDKIRAFNIIKYLSKNHLVSLLCLVDLKEDLRYVKDLQNYCKSIDAVRITLWWQKIISILSLLFSRRPITLSYFYSRKLKKILNNRMTTEDFDIIYVHSSSMAQYVLKKNIPKIMDFVDVDSEKWLEYSKYTKGVMSFLYLLEGKRLRRYEKLLINSFDHCVVVSHPEKELFNSFIHTDNLSVISQGVDMENYKSIINKFEPYTLLFIGGMYYFPYADGILYFYKYILPIIRREVPDVKFFIVGNNPPKKILSLVDDKNIIVTGFVDDVRPYLEKASVYVVPLRMGQGLQNKILEAMACGIPVVTTPVGFRGINAIPEEEIFVCNDDKEFAERVIQLFTDTGLHNKLSQKGKKVIEERYDWNLQLNQIEDLITKLCNEKR